MRRTKAVHVSSLNSSILKSHFKNTKLVNYQKINSNISSIVKVLSPISDDLHTTDAEVIMTRFWVERVFLLHWKIDQYQLLKKALASQRTHQSSHIFIPNYVINFKIQRYFLHIWYNVNFFIFFGQIEEYANTFILFD